MTRPFATAHAAPAFVAITILGRRCLVRPDVTLVWALYDEGYIESANRFCWNGTCLNCMVSLMTPSARAAVRVKACEVFPTEGLAVVKLGGEFRIPLRRAS